jgi:hypothetical protein
VTSLAVLIEQIREHYASREFSAPAIATLVSAVKRSHHDSKLIFPGTGCDCTIDDLVNQFVAVDQVSVDVARIESPLAIFGFSCGYRQRFWQSNEVANRLPGKKNRALAKAIMDTLEFVNIPVYVQFEICDALEENHEYKPKYSAPVEDMGTKQAIDRFLKSIGWENMGSRNVVVIAHRHHVGRCLLLLKDRGLTGYVPSLPNGLPLAYDDDNEAQARAKTEDALIASDFISMVRRVLDQSNRAG